MIVGVAGSFVFESLAMRVKEVTGISFSRTSDAVFYIDGNWLHFLGAGGFSGLLNAFCRGTSCGPLDIWRKGFS